jgi:hypothetical protein
MDYDVCGMDGPNSHRDQSKPVLTPLEIELGEALEHAANYIEAVNGSPPSPFSIVGEALAHYRGAKGEK